MCAWEPISLSDYLRSIADRQISEYKHILNNSSFGRFRDDQGLRMTRIGDPEEELFDGPFRRDRAYLLPLGHAGVFATPDLKDRDKYHLIFDRLLPGIECLHYLI